ncbi:MAG: type I methionyl aminopeptidase [Dehalococcoidia bacterium]|nr:type I methionyl aminopeptidase [Dehalococcoidia bacterium]
MGIIIKSPSEIRVMRQAGKIVAIVLEILSKEVKPGITTGELDGIAVKAIEEQGGRPSFKGYRGFPASICTSVNEQVVHGIPGGRILKEGDIIAIDVGAIYNGFQGDAAVTVGVGKISPEARSLIDATSGSLEAGIKEASAGARLSDISAAIQAYAESRGFAVVREYVGHGIGREMHEKPEVPNFGLPGKGPILRQGMTVALEPMINAGGWRTKVLDDHWTVVTEDGKLSAHFEHTIAITDGAPEVLTRL